MAKRARKDDEEDRPRRYRTALEEIRHELRELWGGPPYDRGDKLPATLAREECRQLITAYTSGKWAFRNNLISRILYATGMRGEELENLKVCDLSDSQGTIFIRAGCTVPAIFTTKIPVKFTTFSTASALDMGPLKPVFPDPEEPALKDGLCQ